MSKIIHLAIERAKLMKEICEPLQQLGITYFGHVRIDETGHFSAINNNPEFHSYYMDKKYYNYDIFMAKENRHTDFVIWDNVHQTGKSSALYREGFDFGLRHTFTLVEATPSAKNYYYFATKDSNNAINQIYINNIQLLKLFILYFKDKISSHKILKSVYDDKFGLDHQLGGYLTTDENNTIDPKVISNLINSLPINKFQVCNTREQNGITKRELQVLIWFNYGKTASEVAMILDISEATVNSHILSLKEKFGVRTLFQLGALFKSSFPDLNLLDITN